MTRIRSYSIFIPAIAFGLLTFAPVSDAHSADIKEPEVHFYPAKKWNVASAPLDIAGAAVKQCTITSEFNNGFIVQLSGSHRWVEALQIDFRQNAFDPGQTYDVKLSVPGIKNKTLSGRAEGSNQMVIAMKGQKDFYQAMRDSSVFDLKIDENEFRFYMVGFDKNAKNFERCMAGGTIENPSDTKSAMYNEAIAYEEAEKTGVPITEILPDDPRPTVTSAEDNSDVEDIAEIVPIEPQFGIRNGSDRKRLSETLAEEISRNPSIASADEDAVMPDRSIEQMQKDAELAEQKKILTVPTTEIEPEKIATQDEIAVVIPEKEADITQQAEMAAQTRTERIRAAAQAQLNAERKTQESIAPQDNANEPLAMNEYERVEMIVDTTTIVANDPVEETVEMVQVEEVAEVTVPVIDARAPEPFTPSEEMQDIPPISAAAQALLDQPEKSAMPEPARVKVTKQKTEKIEADLTEYEDLTAVEPASAPTNRAEETALARKITNLEKELSALKTENKALNEELEDAIQESRDEELSISNENWNLEKVTRRYNEAERQLKRLGQQLQQERTACSVEKQELEALLFDPSVTEDAQIAKLARLQRELEETKAQLRTLTGSQ